MIIPSPAQIVIDRISQTCPNCHEEEVRLHLCYDSGCGYKGCIKCVMAHEEGVAQLTANQDAGTHA